MRHEDEIEKEDPKSLQLKCMADGCPNRNSGDGLCEWHGALKSSMGFPAMTEFLCTSEYRQMSWLWQRLMMSFSYDLYDEVRPGLTKQVREHARLLYKKMIAFGCDPKELEPIKGPGHNEDVSPRSYGLRMRYIVMRKVCQRIDDQFARRVYA